MHHHRMESMQFDILSVVASDRLYRARARATAQDARITLEVTFVAYPEASRSELWDRARDEVLRYLASA